MVGGGRYGGRWLVVGGGRWEVWGEVASGVVYVNMAQFVDCNNVFW